MTTAEVGARLAFARRRSALTSTRNQRRVLALLSVAENALRVVHEANARGGITTQATVDLEAAMDRLGRELPAAPAGLAATRS